MSKKADLYSRDEDGNLVDRWIWDELLQDDDLPDPYARELGDVKVNKALIAAKRELPIHEAADAHVARVGAGVTKALRTAQRAINLGKLRAAVKRNDRKGAAAAVLGSVDVMQRTLRAVLPELLVPVFRDGALAGISTIRPYLSTFRASARREEEEVELDLDFDFDPKDEYAQEWAEKHAGKLAKGLSKTTRDEIRRAVSDGFETGELDAMEDRIIAAVGDATRGSLIARQETMTAANEGQRQAWQEMVEQDLLPEDVQRQVVITEVDPCEDCLALEGELVGLHETYSNGMVGPPFHVKCRCSEGIAGKKSRSLGGPGSGNFGHSGRPGQQGGSSSGDPLHDEPQGQHTPQGLKKVLDFLEKKVGPGFYPHGSVGRGQTSVNDFDIIYSPYKNMSPAEKEAALEAELEEAHRLEGELHDRLKRGEITEKEFYDEMYGDPNEPQHPVWKALKPLGYEIVGGAEWSGVQTTRLQNKRTKHVIEIWEEGDPDSYRGFVAAGGPGSGNFGHAGRPGQRGGSSPREEEELPAAPKRPDPSMDEIQKAYALTRMGWSKTAIATHLNMGGKSGSRGKIVEAILEKYNEDGSLKAEAPRVEDPRIEKLGPVDPPRVPPFLGHVPVEVPKAGEFIFPARRLIEKGGEEFPRFRGDMGKLVEGHDFERKTEWALANGRKVPVHVDAGVDLHTQRQVQFFLAGMPPEVWVEGHRVRIMPEIISKAYGAQKTDGWKAAGQYSNADKEIRISAGVHHNYMEQVLFHEKGHALHYEMKRAFGIREFRKAYREDRKELTAGKRDKFKREYAEFAYWRVKWQEVFAEGVASHLSNYDKYRADRFLRAFPRSGNLLRRGLEKLIAKGRKK